MSGELTLTGCIFWNAVNFADDEDVMESKFFADCNNDSRYGGNQELDPALGDPFNENNPNFKPAAPIGSPVDPHTVDSWFDSTNYVRAMANWDWTEGWTTHAHN